MIHIVADNSISEASAGDNRQVCAAYGAAYVRLPTNPWTARSPSRSHGAALNWMWHNILKPAAPDGDLSLKAKKREAVLRLLAPALEVPLGSARQGN